MKVTAPKTRSGRLATSWLVLVVMVAFAAAVLAWSTQAVNARMQAKAEGRAQASAELVAALVARDVSDVGGQAGGQAGGRGPLSAAQRDRLDADVTSLRNSEQLLGVGVWRLDGTSVFSAGAVVPAEDVPSGTQLTRARLGEAWTEPASHAGSDPAVQVFLPFSSDGVGTHPPTGVMEVVMAQPTDAGSVNGGFWRQQLGALVILLLFSGGMVWLRRGLLQREQQARQDPLTGLLNRRALMEDAAGILKRGSAQAPAALLVIDLDDFKSINDTLGHAAGDVLIQQVADRLREGTRPGDLLIRLGGDEFAVLLPAMAGTTPLTRAKELLGRIRGATFTVDSIDLTVNASIGVALAPQHGTEVAVLLQRADVAMYQAKATGGGAAVYDPASDEHTVGQLTMFTELHQALVNDEFVLHYQPKVTLDGGKVTSVEALVRWQHPTRGLLPPGAFLPLVEGSALMGPLTRWVLRTALQQAASWARAGMPLQVSVNISPQSLLEADLPARVLAALLAAEVPASLLQLEVTETAVMSDPERATAILRQLHARGVQIAIDDFGAGSTSLTHLRTLPIGELKIDRSLVIGVLDRPEDEAVTQAVIDLSHRLGFTVVAEGVEDEPLLRRLTDMGCDHVQGYFYTPPLPAAALEGWLTQRDQTPQPIGRH